MNSVRYDRTPSMQNLKASTELDGKDGLLGVRKKGRSLTIARRILGSNASSLSARAVIITYVYGALHGATDQLLPACFKSLERDLGFTPKSLGFAASISRVSHVVTCPFWGVATDCLGRRRLFASTALGWGAATALFFYVQERWHVLSLMCLTGIFMAAMGPLSQKVLAEEVHEGERGRNFGILHFFQSFGRILSLMLATSISGLMVSGLEGWRYAFGVTGLAIVYFGVFLAVYVTEEPIKAESMTLVQQFSTQQLAYVFSNGSIWTMLLMGILNGIPRSALNFSTMYFQYCGIADWWASFIVSCSWIAAMLVAPIVGCVGDLVHEKHPRHGRQCLAQVSIGLRSILMSIMLLCIPRSPHSLWVFVIVATLIGFLAGWPGVGVNRPIMTEIVKPEHRATIFAMVSCFEGVGAALFGAPVVGYLSEHVFGYSPITRGLDTMSVSEELRVNNARAISLAMLSMTVGPWVLNILAYGILHCTYRKDKKYGTS